MFIYNLKFFYVALHNHVIGDRYKYKIICKYLFQSKTFYKNAFFVWYAFASVDMYSTHNFQNETRADID